MKSQAANLLATAGLLSSRIAGLPARPHSTMSSACHSFGESGLMKLIDYDAQTINGTVLAEGTLSVVDNARGNAALHVQFAECDWPFMGFTSGTSRNFGGSNGAAIEYFGHIVQQSYDGAALNFCLTASGTASEGSVNMRFAPCVYGDDKDEQLRQWFAFQIDRAGHRQLAYVGKKNSTTDEYTGAENWVPAPKRHNSAFSRVLQATPADDAPFSLRIQGAPAA